jgi:uncharacterized repeat protein (TIGR01451 family)
MNRSFRILASLASFSAILASQPLLPPLPAHAQTANGAGCPAGTAESGPNLVFNGDFAISPGPAGVIPAVNPGGFTSDLPYRGDFLYPDDNGANGVGGFLGGLSIENGAVPGAPAGVVNGYSLAPTIPNYLYSNPNQNNAGQILGVGFFNPVIWRQTVTGLSPNTTYNFKAYFLNLLTLGAPVNAAAPNIQLHVDSLPPLPPPVLPRQAWVLVPFSFTTGAGQTSVQLQIVDAANTINGDDFGVTAVGLRQCVPVQPTLGVAKQAGTPIANSDGTYTIPYTIRVQNFGASSPNFDILNLQLTDNLAAAFATAKLNSVTNIQSPTLTVNPNFNGGSDQNMLRGVDTLVAGGSGQVSFNVNVTPGTGPNGFGPFNNVTTASGITRSGGPVSDPSKNGVTPAPGSAVPTVVNLRPPSGGRPVPPVGPPNFRLVKRITAATRNRVPLTFNTFVDDPNDTNDTAPGWSQLSPVGVFAVDPAILSGDEVEYTVYFLSDGASPAVASTICDLIPERTTLIPNTTQVKIANGPLGAGGTVFSPLAPLPAGNSCTNQSNSNGAVIFDLGDVSNAAGSNFGFVRFRVKIN